MSWGSGIWGSGIWSQGRVVSSQPQTISHGPFSDIDDYILNFKPRITFTEPDSQFDNESFYKHQEEPTELEDARKRTENIIKNYEAIGKLADFAQKRIDEKVKPKGLEINLDPVKDALTISALKRMYPGTVDAQGNIVDAPDYTKITYDQYRNCLSKTTEQTLDAQGNSTLPLVSQKDIEEAKQDPLRTNFGGLANPAGKNRPEISSAAANAINPIDLSLFQAAGVIALFALLKPLITAQQEARVAQHLAEVPHRPI